MNEFAHPYMRLESLGSYSTGVLGLRDSRIPATV
jgi:hypothetical protein